MLALLLATSIGFTQDQISHGTRGAAPSFTQQRIQVPEVFAINVQEAAANAVNNSNFTTGVWRDPDISTRFYSYIWDHRKHSNSEWTGGDQYHNMVRLAFLDVDDIRAYDISSNSRSTIVGKAKIGSGLYRAAYWDTAGLNEPTAITSQTFPYDAECIGVNDLFPPTIVGRGEIGSSGPWKGFYKDGNGAMTQIPDFNPSGGVTTGDVIARDVNDLKKIVGHGFRTVGGGTRRRAFWWQIGDTNLTLLALPSGYDTADAFAINEAGNIIGWMDGPSVAQVACYWTNANATAVALTVPMGTTASEAYDINDSGHACGRVLIGGLHYGVLWVNGLSSVYRANDLTLGGYQGRISELVDLNEAPSGLLAACGTGVMGSATEAILIRAHLALGPDGGRSSGKAIGSVSFTTTGNSELDLPAGGEGEASIAYEYDSSPDDLGQDRVNSVSISAGGSVSPGSVSANDESSVSGPFTCTALPGSEGTTLSVTFEIDGQSGDYAYQRVFGTIRVYNAAPTVNGLSPSVAEWGSPDVPITVTGTKFVGTNLGNWSDSVVWVDGVALPTTVVSASQLTVVIPASALVSPDSLPVSVVNSAPGGGTSNSVFFTVSKANTTLTAGSYQGSRLQTIPLSATLKRTSTNAPVAGKTVSFTVDGFTAGSGVTDSSGIATANYEIPASLSLGNHSVKATFAGDTLYNSQEVTTQLTVVNAAPLALLAGSCIRFDGSNDRVQIPDLGLSIPSDEVTIEFWVKADQGRNQWMMVTENQSANNRIGIFGPTASNSVRWDFGSVSGGGTMTQNISGLVGAWNHLAFTTDDTFLFDEMQIFKNGVLAGTGSTADKFTFSSVDLMLGGSTSQYFDGEIDEVRIWSYVKTQSEIGRTMRSPITGNEPGLVFYWRLDNGAGLVADGEGSKAIDGNLLGGATWIPSNAGIDTIWTYEDMSTPITLRGFDADGDPLTFEIVDQPINGVISGSGANITYVPNADYLGDDEFSYRVSDGTAWSLPFTVSIYVEQRDYPATYNDYAVGPQGSEVGTHNAANLAADDGTRATFLSTVVPNVSIPPIKVTASFTATVAAADAEGIELSVDAQSQYANIQQRLSLINQTNDTLTLVDTYTFTSANSDVRRTAMLTTNPSQYIESGTNKVEAVIQYIKVGVIPQQLFRGRIDHARVSVRKKV